jgi:hypothetical protein
MTATPTRGTMCAEACAHSDHREHFDRFIVNAQTDARDRSEATLALFSSWWASPCVAIRP